MRSRQTNHPPFLVCLVLDVLTLNPVSRKVTAFAEGPVGRRIRRRVRLGMAKARVHVHRKAEEVVRRVVYKISF